MQKKNKYTKELHLSFLETLSFLISIALSKDDKIVKMATHMFVPKLDSHFIKSSFKDLMYLLESSEDKKMAVDYCKILGDLFYFMFHKIESQSYIYLKDELEFLKTYIKALKLRYAEDFEFEVNEIKYEKSTLKDIEECKLPPMMIQPYVENAIKHGLKYSPHEKKQLRLFFKVEENDLICCIRDNGVGINTARNSKANYESDSSKDEMRSLQRNDIRKKYINLYNRKWNPNIKTQKEIIIEEKDLTDDKSNTNTGTEFIIRIPLNIEYPPLIELETILD